MEEPVSRRLRSRDSSGTATASSIQPRRAFGDASNRQGNESDKEMTTKRTGRSAKSMATAVNEPKLQPVAHNIKTNRGKTKDTSNTTKDNAFTETTRRSSSRIRKSLTADSKSETDNLALKSNGGTKRTSKGAVEPKATSSRCVKRAKTETSQSIKKAPCRSNRISNDAKSKPFVVKEVPIVQAHPQFNIPPDFGLTRKDLDSGQNFTHGIAYYDAPDRANTLLCKDYVTDMFQHMYEAETRTRPRTYMDEQVDINAKMRAILIDWLVEVHMKFRLNPNTLYLCVNIIDRYCSQKEVKRSKLQLVGVTALLVACKHEEIYPPEVRDCVYITDRAYNRQEVLDMEQSILNVLNWKISVPTAYPFLHRFLSLVKASERAKHAAHYYLERSLQEHDMLVYRPSEVSCAAVILAINNPDILSMDEGYDRVAPGLPEILLEYSGFDPDWLIEICRSLAGKVANECITASRRKLTAVKKKFESSKYLKVSSEVELPTVTHLRLNRHPSIWDTSRSR